MRYDIRPTVRTLMFGILLVAVALGSYIAGYRAGHADGWLKPPNFAQNRALVFGRTNSTRSARESGAICIAARQLESQRPGFLTTKPGVKATPYYGNPYSDMRWTVTFTDPRSKKPLSRIIELDDVLLEETRGGRLSVY
jgi:hypothetical protein